MSHLMITRLYCDAVCNQTFEVESRYTAWSEIGLRNAAKAVGWTSYEDQDMDYCPNHPAREVDEKETEDG